MQCLQRRQKEIDDKKILNMSFKKTDKIIEKEKKKFGNFLMQIQKETKENA